MPLLCRQTVVAWIQAWNHGGYKLLHLPVYGLSFSFHLYYFVSYLKQIVLGLELPGQEIFAIVHKYHSLPMIFKTTLREQASEWNTRAAYISINT